MVPIHPSYLCNLYLSGWYVPNTTSKSISPYAQGGRQWLTFCTAYSVTLKNTCTRAKPLACSLRGLEFSLADLLLNSSAHMQTSVVLNGLLPFKMHEAGCGVVKCWRRSARFASSPLVCISHRSNRRLFQNYRADVPAIYALLTMAKTMHVDRNIRHSCASIFCGQGDALWLNPLCYRLSRGEYDFRHCTSVLQQKWPRWEDLQLVSLGDFRATQVYAVPRSGCCLLASSGGASYVEESLGLWRPGLLVCVQWSLSAYNIDEAQILRID